MSITGMKIDIPVAISYSGGASSGWLVHAVRQGIVPRPRHFAVFWVRMPEHDWTFDEVEKVRRECEAADIEFIECLPEVSLDEHLLQLETSEPTRLDHPPLWIAKGSGRGRASHRCTKAFKVAVMRRAQSEWLAANRLPKKIIKWIGFGADEAHRAQKTHAKQDVLWEILDFPGLRVGAGRARMRAEFEQMAGRPPPLFSMCTLCPFKSPRRWQQTGQSDLRAAVRIDEAIRDLDCVGLTDGPAYLSDRLIPVADLVRRGDPQPELPGLESYCDGGACFL